MRGIRDHSWGCAILKVASEKEVLLKSLTWRLHGGVCKPEVASVSKRLR